MRLSRAEVVKLRLLLLFAAIAVTGWGIFLDQAFQSQSGMMWVRAALSFICLLGFSYTFFKPVTRFTYDLILFICTFFILIGANWILQKTNYSMSIVVANMVLILTALSVIRNRYFVLALGVLYILNYLPLFLEAERNYESNLILGLVALAILAGAFIHLTRHDLEKTIHEKERWFQDMIDGMGDRVLLVDLNGKVILANTIANKIFPDIEGKNVIEATQQDWELFEQEGTHFQSERWLYQDVFQRENGRVKKILHAKNKFSEVERWVHITTAPIKLQPNGKPEIVMIHYRDITDFQRQQEVITNQQAALANASRLTAMGEMAGGIAHEINNPLTIIAGRVEQLQQMNESGDCKKEDVDRILIRIGETIFRIKKLIASMKSVSRNYENDPFESCDITIIIQDTLDLCMEGLRAQGIQLTYEIPAGLNLDCRPWQISQVLLNLLNNSKDAVKNLNEKWIRLKVELLNEKIFFRVTDSGHGISKEIMNKMMQPFFTTKEVGQGTGLGLSISLGIAKSHHGNLFVNQDSSNTEMVLVIPRHQSSTV